MGASAANALIASLEGPMFRARKIRAYARGVVSNRRMGSRPEWQRIGNEIDAAMIFARADFVSVDRRLHQRWTLNHFFIAVWSAKETECKPAQ